MSVGVENWRRAVKKVNPEMPKLFIILKLLKCLSYIILKIKIPIILSVDSDASNKIQHSWFLKNILNKRETEKDFLNLKRMQKTCHYISKTYKQVNLDNILLHIHILDKTMKRQENYKQCSRVVNKCVCVYALNKYIWKSI